METLSKARTIEQKNPALGARSFPIDILRGLLIVLMTLDHANYHIAQQHSSGEHWGGFFPIYTDPLHFLTRLVTHISAPGFFFLLGVGMIMFPQSRRAKGWSNKDIYGHFLLRGMSLIVLQQFMIVNQIWSLSTLPFPQWYVGVLIALGAAMILCIPLLDLKPIYLAFGALALFISLEVLTPDPAQWGMNFDNLLGIILIYSGGQGELWVNYPILAWLEVVVFGLLFGKWLLTDSKKAYGRALWLGLIFLSVFTLLRLNNGFGNIRPYQPGNWINFLNLVKYPPSMTFTLFTMGVNLILLWFFSRINRGFQNSWNPLLVFGRVPLFAYILHLGIYALMGRLLTPNGSSLLLMYPLWFLGLVLLYPLARWYGMFKMAQSDRSWVRFF